MDDNVGYYMVAKSYTFLYLVLQRHSSVGILLPLVHEELFLR